MASKALLQINNTIAASTERSLVDSSPEAGFEDVAFPNLPGPVPSQHGAQSMSHVARWKTICGAEPILPNGFPKAGSARMTQTPRPCR